MIGRISRFMTRFVSRWLPDPLIFAMLLTLLTDAPRDKRTYFREINYIAAAFQYQKKNYKSA
ncbi:TIGR00366 family protein [Escherichia coli]